MYNIPGVLLTKLTNAWHFYQHQTQITIILNNAYNNFKSKSKIKQIKIKLRKRNEND